MFFKINRINFNYLYMKKNYHISINQFADFSAATKSGKARILQQQVVPSKILIPWYQSAKGSIKHYFKDVRDHAPLLDGITKVSEKKPLNQRQASDKSISLQALKKISQLELEKHFKGISYEVIKPAVKGISLQDVAIGMSPELVFKTKVRGRVAYGAIKIHISKNKPFSLSQCKQVAALLKHYVANHIAGPGEAIIPALCLCVDIFGERVVSADKHDARLVKEMKALCEEIKTGWPE